MRVLVLGGTGAMGVHLVKLMAQHHLEVFVTTRANRQSEDIVRYIQGNIGELKL